LDYLLSKATLERLMLDGLEHQGAKTPMPTVAIQQQNTSELGTEPEYPNELENIFGKDGLPAISSALSAFQTG